MQMTRLFFISDDLDVLERLHVDLERAGIDTLGIHVLTSSGLGSDRHRRLNAMTELQKVNFARGVLKGAAIGLCASALVLITAYLTGWTRSSVGWVPFVYAALFSFGFSTWEGGFIGFQTRNTSFCQFESTLEAGRHVLFVDIPPSQAEIVRRCAADHPGAEPAGHGPAPPYWAVCCQRYMHRFLAAISH